MADPLAIATTEGQGGATIFKSDYQDPYDIYQKDKATRDALLAKKQVQQAKTAAQQRQDLEDLAKIKVEGHVSGLDELAKDKNEMIDIASKALLKDPNVDVYKTVYPKLTQMQEKQAINNQKQKYLDEVEQAIKSGKVKKEDIENANAYLKLPPKETKEYELKNGGPPPLNAEEKYVDYNKDFDNLAKVSGKVKGGNSSLDAQGNIITTDTEYSSPQHNNFLAEQYIKSGLNPNDPNPAAVKLIQEQKALLQDDPLYRIAPDQSNDPKIKTKSEILFDSAKDFVLKGLEARQDKENKSKLSRAPKESTAEQGKKVNVTYDITPSGKHVVNFSRTDPKDNVPLDFVLGNGETVHGVPIRFEEDKNNQGKPNLIVAEIAKDEKGHTFTQYRDIPYNIASPRIKTEYGFTYEDIKGHGPVNKNISVTDYTKNKKPTREISTSTLKGLVGSKGYEGYSEKELRDYYESQGYTVK